MKPKSSVYSEHRDDLERSKDTHIMHFWTEADFLPSAYNVADEPHLDGYRRYIYYISGAASNFLTEMLTVV